jgi:hypothetical protein
MAQIDFDASSVEPSEPREHTILPPGKYAAEIIDSEMRPTSSGGEMLSLTWQIIEGEHANRRLWCNLNLVNNSSKAVDIARRDLSAICRAIGKMQVKDSAELHMRPMLLTVEVQAERIDAGGVKRAARNEIKGYSALNGPVPAAAPAPAARPAAPAGAPWRRAG